MGFEDRDYAWGSPARRAFLGGDGRAVRAIVIVNVAVYVLQLLTARVATPYGPGAITGWFGLDASAVLHGQLWRLLTYAFLHSEGSVWHILINMLWLWSLGRPAEGRLGTQEFTLFYLAGALAGGLVFFGLELAFPSLGTAAGRSVVCVGASGAVMAVVLLAALWDPQLPLNLILITIPIWVVAGLYVVLESYAVLARIGGAALADGTAHGAHFGGLALAYLYHRFDWRLSDAGDAVADRLPRFKLGGGRGPRRPSRRGPALKVFRAEDVADDDDLDARADAVLAKISATGEASLTKRERAVLKEASERAKARRRGR